MLDRGELIAALGATAEAMAQQVTPAALNMMADDLSDFTEDQISSALKNIRKKNRRFCVGTIIEHIQASDGRPTADRAWQMMPKCETETGVISKEMYGAWEVAQDLYYNNDEIGAKIAFNREYTSMVDLAREMEEKPDFTLSLGFDKKKRVKPIIDGVVAGLITQDKAYAALKHDTTALIELATATGDNLLLTKSKDQHRLESSQSSAALAREAIKATKMSSNSDAKNHIAKLISTLNQ